MTINGSNKDINTAGGLICLHRRPITIVQFSKCFAGKKLEKGAYVSVSVYGDVQPAACDRMTGEICRILEEELGIPGNNVYVTSHGVHDWGWNGSNF